MKTLLQRNESEKFVFILQGVHNIFCKSDMFNISTYISGLFKENKITVEAFACDIDFQRLTKICQIIFDRYGDVDVSVDYGDITIIEFKF